MSFDRSQTMYRTASPDEDVTLDPVDQLVTDENFDQ
ncbi:hypothetical protein KIPB_001535, partial [Kipferlia bialata]|eukprot:g1535.t1